MKISEINRKMSAGGGLPGGLHTHSYQSYQMGSSHSHNLPSHGYTKALNQQITEADLVLLLNYDGTIKVLKDRWYDDFMDRPDLNYAIKKFSHILSKMIFKENNLKMFQEGLGGEIRKAIEETINKFHTKGENK